MGFFDDVKNAALRFLPLGRNKASEIEYAAIQEGVPPRNQWFRMQGGDGAIVGHVYVCRCATEYKLALGGIFGWQTNYKCGCGQNYCLKSYLEGKVRQARIAAASIAAGLSPHPTAPEIEMAKQLGKKITVKSGPIEDKELQEAYSQLPLRRAIGNAESTPRFIDTWDEKHGASDGTFKYGGSNPGPEDIADVGFGDPYAASFRRS
ncbi:MAG TPA: hypothetical protein VGT24_10050 [Candidatus Acidoferrales bacterium]|nr:hypothetical protein [Candidatus Acidoferrales bacterium]